MLVNSYNVLKPINEKAIQLHCKYNMQKKTMHEVCDKISKRFGCSEKEFYEMAQNAKIPFDFCPTVKGGKCEDKDYRYRQINAWCNNLNSPDWGVSNTPYARLLPPFYEDDCDQPTVHGKSGNLLPNAREVALKLFRQVDTNSITTSMFLYFGKLVNNTKFFI